jgi:nitroimidazol reductase NimA-like FMN-containing flavoprotein (pyridoxamine 5'-phosphate oxidase superfamily)
MTAAEGGAPGGPRLDELSLEECLEHLRAGTVGRLAVVFDDRPLVVPVNYRLVETVGLRWVAIRTKPGGLIERASQNVAFEIDGVDEVRRQGWSVLVRGTRHSLDPEAAGFRERFDTHPWLADRDDWFVIEPFSITGRELHAAPQEWAFHLRAYL